MLTAAFQAEGGLKPQKKIDKKTCAGVLKAIYLLKRTTCRKKKNLGGMKTQNDNTAPASDAVYSSITGIGAFFLNYRRSQKVE